MIKGLANARLDESKHSCGIEPMVMPNDENFSVEFAVTLMPSYEVGELVWAKVKSHPWWPGQIFDVADASDQARSLEKPGRILIAFYGDHTFAWLEHSHILKFKPNFEEKAKITNTKNFHDAILEALDEVCKRAHLGLQCQCRKRLLGNELTFNDVDDGVQGTHEGLRLHKDMSTSKETFNARRTLSFLKDLACSPCNPSSSNLDASVLHGHVLGIRTRFFTDIDKDETLEEGVFASIGKDKTLEERMFASSGRAVVGTSEVQSLVKCKKRGNACYPSEDSDRAKRCHVTGFEVDNEDKETKLELREQNRGLARSLNEISSFCDDKASHFLMQISEALQYVAIDPLCHHGSYNTIVTKMAVFLKFRDLVFQKSMGYGYHLQTLGQKETQMKDAPHVGTSYGEHDSPNLVAKAVRYWRPRNQKQRTADAAHDSRLKNLETLNSTKAQPHLQCVEPAKVCHEGKKLSSDKEGTKTDVVSGRSFEGVSQAHSSAPRTAFSQKLDVHELLIEAHRKTSDITKEAPAKLDLHELLIEAHKSKSDFTKEAPSKFDVHELLVEAQKSDCTKEVPVKVLKKALKNAAVGGDVFSEVQSDVRMDAKQHLETRSLKGSVEFSEDVSKLSAFEGQVFSEANEDSKVCAGHFSSANTDKGISVQHFSEANPGIGAPVEKKSNRDFHRVSCAKENMENSSPIRDNRASSSQIHDNGASSTPMQDDGASSQWPVGLFMKFPSTFSLPLETQLNAMFAAFGALETAGTRVFRDTASAQVIFKHGNEAVAAYKCVKGVSPFGKVPVAFKLQHFAHPSSVKDNRQHDVAAAS